MHLSLQFVVGLIVLLLFFAGTIALYFALANIYTTPLILVALINVEAVVFLVFLITRGIIKPLGYIRSILTMVGHGDFSSRIKPSSIKEIRELGTSVNDMINNLQKSREHEKEIERVKTEFVSMAAHQLRTPLSSVKWALQELLDGDMGRLVAKQKEFIERSYESNEHMIRLVNDLLNIARIEGGRYLFNVAPLQLKEVVKELFSWYQEEAKRRGIALSLECPKEEIPKVLADHEKIRLVIQNLMDNALRYTPKGGEMTLGLAYDTKNIEVFVRDNGIGIPQSQQARVFQRFFRAENARNIDAAGTGLGLYLTKNIVEAHGGKIWFESEENKGSTFFFTIPLKGS